jgi:hypothetical protein
MTPERARDLAAQWNAKVSPEYAAIYAFEAAILQACAEQREEDARICRTRGNKSGDDYEAGGCYGCEIAIREGK